MKGFFTDEELAEDFAIEEIKNVHPLCEKCGMYKGCVHPRTKHTGQGKRKILIVAEANGETEDILGKQLAGEAGQFLEAKLKEHGLDLKKDFWKINSCNCRPFITSPDGKRFNRAPTRAEIVCCRPMVEQTIEELNPEFIWLLGGIAVESFYMDDFKDCSITRWRKHCIPDSRWKAWILPMFDPSYAKRMEKNATLQAVYDTDLKWAVSCLDKKLPEYENPEGSVVVLTEYNHIVETLGSVLDDEPETLFLDYETSGLKPQARGHKVASISFTTSLDEVAYSFPYQYAGHFSIEEQRMIRLLWRKILTNPKIRKVAHNLKFEDSWSKFIFGTEIINKHWCTMLHAHVQDCRKKYTGLKFQSYIHFGVYPYDKFIKSFLNDTGNGFNRVDEAPIEKLLLYGGIDSWLLKRLYDKQVRSHNMSSNVSVKSGLASAYAFFHQGNNVLCEVQNTGICVDEEYYERMDVELTEKKRALSKSIYGSEEAQKFLETYGKTIDIGSPKDLTNLITKILELELPDTEKGNKRTDVKALLRLDREFFRDIIRLRKIEKIQGTYLAEFKRELTDGKMYPFVDLNIPVSYRSSSSKPNIQNVPVREKEAKRICRSGIIPSPGNQLLESDFKGIEVAIAACYTEDPSLVKYVSDPNTDMHRDTAADIWIMDREHITKDMRFYAKNCWVFPQFYGSYYGSCAPELWENVIEADLHNARGEPVYEVLRDRGISTLDQFTQHCWAVEDKFWNERFRVYKQWKDAIQSQYQRKGYYETFFGFRYSGHLTYNQLCNYPIQGTAFHCLLWTLIELHKLSKQENWRSKIIGQIHDSIIWDTHPEEVKHVIKSTIDIGTKKIREAHSWIIVPLQIEFELAPVNGSWFEKEEIKV